MTFGEQRRVVGEWPLRRGLLRLPSKWPHPTFEETTLPQCGRLVRAPGLLLIALHVAWGSAITIKRSTFMTKEIRFCLKADEAPSLLGAYAIAIELADTVTVTLSSWAPSLACWALSLLWLRSHGGASPGAQHLASEVVGSLA
jgi:hypothetical protein